MFNVYEMYGSREANPGEIRSLLSSSLGMVFEHRESYYLGEYFLARGRSGHDLTIESNRLEDEDGPYFQEAEFSEYETLVRLEYLAAKLVDGEPATDSLSRALEKVQELTLLRRNFMPGDGTELCEQIVYVE